MDDIKKAYFDDLKDKAYTARSAHNRGHTSGRQIKIPSEKELQAMNGPTHTVNTNEFITYAEFKKLPDGLKKEWLLAMFSKFDICGKTITDAWGISKTPLYGYCEKFGIKLPKRKANREAEKAFFEFAKVKVPDETEPEPVKAMAVTKARFTLCGAYDEESLLQKFRVLVPGGKQVAIDVEITTAL